MATVKSTAEKRDPYQEATDKIIAALEGGTAPWQRPWELRKGGGMPSNGVTGRSYHGVNVVLLAIASMQNSWTDNRFATFKQGKDVGASVLKGSKGTTIYFSKPMRIKEKGEGGQPARTEDGQEKYKNIYLLRAHTVFNAAQFDKFPELASENVTDHEWTPHSRADKIVSSYGVPIEHGGNMAYYVPSQDRIVMPDRTQFASPDDYYATLLHEIGHSTGHPDRLNRVLTGSQKTPEYAFEELIAELSALYVTSDLGLTGVTEDANVNRHAAYVESWLTALRGDKKLIFKAAREAEKVHELVMSFDPSIALIADAALVEDDEMDAGLSLTDGSDNDATLATNAMAALSVIDLSEEATLASESRASFRPR